MNGYYTIVTEQFTKTGAQIRTQRGVGMVFGWAMVLGH